MGNDTATGSLLPKAKKYASNPVTLAAVVVALLTGAAGRQVIISFEEPTANNPAAAEIEVNSRLKHFKEVQEKQDRRIEAVEKTQVDVKLSLTALKGVVENQNTKLENQNGKLDEIKASLRRIHNERRRAE